MQRRSKKPYIRKIDFVFHNELEIRQIVRDERNNTITPVIRNASGIGDPTASQAIRNVTLLPQIKIKGEILRVPEAWLIVCGKTWEWAKRQQDCRYEVAKRRYSGEDYRITCYDLHVSHQTVSRMMELFRMYAALHAVQMRLIDIDENFS